VSRAKLTATNRIADSSEIKGEVTSTTMSYDYLIYGVGAEVQTFNIPGVKERALFMKELADADRVCYRI
jgi:NADH:ubiquinone reductase (non-electrogenic)